MLREGKLIIIPNFVLLLTFLIKAFLGAFQKVLNIAVAT